MAKAVGIIRRLDDLGRIVIPREIRRSLKIEEGEPLEILQVGNKIEVSKQKSNTCAECGSFIEDSYKYCPNCGKEINIKWVERKI